MKLEKPWLCDGRPRDGMSSGEETWEKKGEGCEGGAILYSGCRRFSWTRRANGGVRKKSTFTSDQMCTSDWHSVQREEGETWGKMYKESWKKRGDAGFGGKSCRGCLGWRVYAASLEFGRYC